jgi:hypothetical protein
MKQQTFATVKGFEKHSRKTCKKAFLSRTERLVVSHIDLTQSLT